VFAVSCNTSRMRAPMSVPPVSRVAVTVMPSARNDSTNERDCVDFPQPSMPSNAM